MALAAVAVLFLVHAPSAHAWTAITTLGSGVSTTNPSPTLEWDATKIWEAYNDDTYVVQVRTWNGLVWTVVPSAGNGGGSIPTNPALAWSGTQMWASFVDGTSMVQVKNWNGTVWTPIASPGGTGNALINSEPSIAWAGGTLWVAFQDINRALVVRSWNGTIWTTIASPGTNFPAAVNTYPSIEWDGTKLWLIYNNSSNDPIIQTWNGVIWTTVAPAIVTGTGRNTVPDLTWDGTYMWGAYSDATNNVVVKAFDGTVWGTATNPGTGVANFAYPALTWTGTAMYASHTDTVLNVRTYYGNPVVNMTLPSIGGVTIVGQVLSVSSNGTWTGAPTFTRQWRRCNSVGGACVDIAGATGATYTLAAADVNNTIRVVATGTGGIDTGTGTSNATAVIAGLAPSNTVVPTISGVTTLGVALTSTNGTLTGTAPITYTYQWQQSTNGGGSWSDIVGATAAGYTLANADVNYRVRIAVTGTNVCTIGCGATTAYSAMSAVIAGTLPTNTVLPSISGTAQQGQLLTAANGTWTGYTPQVFSYQWRRCNAAGAACVDIVGATSSTYTLVSADVATTTRVIATSTNVCTSSCGATPATSVQTVLVIPGAVSGGQVATGTSILSGTTIVMPVTVAVAGNDFVAIPIVFTGAGITVSSIADNRGNRYWFDRFSNNGTAVRNEVWSSFITAPLLVGDTITVTLSAATTSRAAGVYSFSGVQAHVVDVTNAASGASTAPTVNAVTTYAYDLVFGSVGTNGPNTDTIVPTAPLTALTKAGTLGGTPDVTTFPLMHFVAATGTYPSSGTLGISRSWADTVATYRITDGATAVPTNTVTPTLSGITQVGQLMTVANGTWTGAPTFTYSWSRCDNLGANCQPLAGATANTYTLVAGDDGNTVRATVIGTNAGGSRYATTVQSAVITYPPANPPTAPVAVGGWNVTDLYNVALSWTAPVGGATSYKVRWSVDGYATVLGNPVGTTFTKQSLSANTPYTFKICSVNPDGLEEATCAGPVSATTPPLPPSTITSLNITDVQADFSWITAPGATSTELKIFTDATCTTVFLTDPDIASPFTRAGLSRDRNYWYQLRSYSALSTAWGGPSVCTALSTVNGRTSLTFTVDSPTVALGMLYPGQTAGGTSTLTTQTYGATGYQISARAGLMTSGGNTIPGTLSGTVGAPPGNSAGAWSGSGFGFTVASATNLEAGWAAGTKWARFNAVAEVIHATGAAFVANTANSTTTVVNYQLTIPGTQASGAYATTVTYTAIATP